MWKISCAAGSRRLFSAVVLAATMTSGIAGTASASGDTALRGGTAGGIPFSSAHDSVLQIRANEALPQRRAVVVGLNKSVMVEMPRELRDVIVSNPEFMDAVVQSSNRVYLIGKKIGSSNAFFFDTNGEQVLVLEVRVEPDMGPLDAMFRKLLPGSNIKTEVLNDTLILTGSVRSPTDSNRAVDIASRFAVTNPSGADRQKGKVINMLAVEGDDQVMLRVTVAEVQRAALKQLGINLGAQISSGNLSTTLLTANSLPLTAAAGLGQMVVPGVGTVGAAAGATVGCTTAGVLCNWSTQNPGGAGTFGNSGLSGRYLAGDTLVSHAIRALERHGLVKTLAEPNLTAVSGETAKFLAGGEYPFPSVDSLGAISVTFKEFGVGLSFTPVVLTEGRISLKIETEVSELDSSRGITVGGTSVPAIKKRSAKSTVEMGSGASLALAGMISDDVRQNIDGLPGLKDMPVLGTLFRSRDFIRNETELVVIVTPYMVRPVARQKLARPDDGLAPASDVRANLMGHLNRVYGRGTVMPNGGLKGDYGFIVD